MINVDNHTGENALTQIPNGLIIPDHPSRIRILEGSMNRNDFVFDIIDGMHYICNKQV